MGDLQVRKRFVKELRAKATPSELCFKKLLCLNGIRHNFQRVFTVKRKKHSGKYDKSTKFYIADFYLPEYATIIEIDGGYHNDQASKDIDRSLDLVLNGQKHVRYVLRFTNNDVATNPEYMIGVIKSLKPVRLVKGIKGEPRRINKAHNAEIARQNEIRAIANTA